MIRTAEKAAAALSWLMTLLLGFALAVFIGYLLVRGVPSLGTSLIFGDVDPVAALTGRARVFDGLFPAIAGTFALVILSTTLAVPMGLCTGIYLAEYAGDSMKRRLGSIFDILAGIPSIVIGLFGFSLAVFLNAHFFERFGPCLIVSALSLAILVLPYIVRATQRALEELPAGLRRTALALGAGKLQTIVHVLIPNALAGIFSGIILAVGRCAEDTAVILLTGAVASAGIPSSLLARYEALPFYIYYIAGQYTSREELDSGFGACLILLAICGTLFLAAHIIQKKLTRRTLYGI
jgi:phosphate transport system permease protein